MVAAQKRVHSQHLSGLSYLCVIEKTKTGFSAFLPDVPGVVAAAEDHDKLLRLLSDALYLYLSDLDEGATPPEASTQQYEDEELDDYETVLVAPSEPEQVSLEIEKLVSTSGLSYAEVARRMDVPRSALSRLTSPIYRGHSMESLRRIASALGYEVEVTFKRVD